MISPLRLADRDQWMPLWLGYLDFYREILSDELTDLVFSRLVEGTELSGALARDDDGVAIGLVHWQFQPSTWSATSYCYLEDLFVAPSVRRGGVGRALIEHVRGVAIEAGATRLYWHTNHDNTTARSLYDSVGAKADYVRYDLDLI